MERRTPKKNATRRKKANTKDVLGSSGPSKIDSKWKPFYDQLLKLRAQLRRRKGEMIEAAGEEAPTFSTHMADAGTDEYDSSFTLSRVSSQQEMLNEVNQALARIRQGTYGICELTGKRIPLARLKAVPWTRFSTDGERQMEKNGDAKRARLGDRERVKRQNTSRSVGEEHQPARQGGDVEA